MGHKVENTDTNWWASGLWF